MKKWNDYCEIEYPNGRTIIQQGKNRELQTLSIPREVNRFLDTKKKDEIGWIGLTMGTEEDNQDIFIGFIVDKMKYPGDQFKRILKLFEE